jgi:UDP-glucuronate decarboxylase
MDYHRQYGVNVKIVRIFNTYGPGMAADDGRVVSNFITQALSGLPITIYGDGSQTRSFMYIDDLIEALVRMTETAKDVTGPVNLGNPDERSVNELADMVIALTGSHSQLIHTPLPKDDPGRRCPDISNASRILDGWMPKIGIAEGLEKTIDYFRTIVINETLQHSCYMP